MAFVVIDCFESDALIGRDFPANVRVYMLRKSRSQAPNNSAFMNFAQQPSPGSYHCFVDSEIEFGYRLCQLHQYSPTVYTNRSSTAVLEALGIRCVKEGLYAVQAVPQYDYYQPQQAEPRAAVSMHQRAVVCTIKKDALIKYMQHLANPDKPVKNQIAAMNPITNMVNGVIMSKRLPPEDYNAATIAEEMFRSLMGIGIVRILSTGRVVYDESRIKEFQQDEGLRNVVIGLGAEPRAERPPVHAPPAPSIPVRAIEAETPRYDGGTIRFIVEITAEEVVNMQHPTFGALNDMVTRLVSELFELTDIHQIKELALQIIRESFSSKLQIATTGLDISEVLSNPTRHRALLLTRR